MVEWVMMIFAVLTVGSALGVVLARKTLHSALWLVATLFLVAVHFALLDASFLATLQVMIYAGAIMVLVVFVIMLLGLDEQHRTNQYMRSGIFAAPLAILLAISIIWMLPTTGSLIPKTPTSGSSPGTVESPALSMPTGSASPPARTGTATGPTGAKAIGELLFTKYIAVVGITGVLLLAAIMGASLLAFDRPTPLPPGRGLKAKRTR